MIPIFGRVSIYIAKLIDKLDGHCFGGMFSLGVRAVRKDSCIAECAGKELQSFLLCGRVISNFTLNKRVLRRYVCETC